MLRFGFGTLGFEFRVLRPRAQGLRSKWVLGFGVFFVGCGSLGCMAEGVGFKRLGA